jgi:hypothetical protein
VDDLGADEVVLDREQEALVVRDLDEGALRQVVELRVVRQLEQERAELAGLRERATCAGRGRM